MNKFYTPHLDEFRDGVVYYIDDTPQTFILTAFDLNEKVKLKFLDVEDILSLGFNLYGETYDTKVFHKILESTKSASIIELVLMKIGDTPVISLQIDDEQYLASCICKNKFELEFILNRLRL
jgi:hypothetical protein